MALTLDEAFRQARAQMPRRPSVFHGIAMTADRFRLRRDRTRLPGDASGPFGFARIDIADAFVTFDFVPLDRQLAANGGGGGPGGGSYQWADYFQTVTCSAGFPVIFNGGFRLGIYVMSGTWKRGKVSGARFGYYFEHRHPDFGNLSMRLAPLEDGLVGGQAFAFSPDRRRGVELEVSFRPLAVPPI